MTDWTYYIVENCFIVRLDLKTSRAEKLPRNGEWENYSDLRDITYNGRFRWGMGVFEWSTLFAYLIAGRFLCGTVKKASP
jgi:hypothetical protein